MRPTQHRLLLRSGCFLIGLLAGAASPVLAYNSEEHKLLGDMAAAELRIDRSITFPEHTDMVALPTSASMTAYSAAKELAVGFQTNNPANFDENKKKVQDNSYPPGALYRQLNYNRNLWIPPLAMRPDFGLQIAGYSVSTAPTSYTLGDLMAIYGDYRRTVYCNDSGQCFLTNADTPNVSFGMGYDCYLFGVGALDNTPFADCGWRPNTIGASAYLRNIAAGLVPPHGKDGNTAFNTAKEEDDYFEAGWWGDEMMRIAVSNDWHFSDAAVAWYIGMHRLALHYVDRARTDPVYWNHALHYEAHGLHSLSDLFAFGHVVASRDETSHAIVGSHTNEAPYLWMEHVLDLGGAERDSNGRIVLNGDLPAIGDRTHGRNDFLKSYVLNAPTWGGWAYAEEGLHSDFNNAGATVRNLRGDTLQIYGDAKLRDMTPETRDIMKEAIRVSLRSLFDAYVRMDRYGATVQSLGDTGSNYFAALRYIPVYVQSGGGNHFTGRWTRYARRIDVLTGSNIVPASPLCEMPVINGGSTLPPATATPCTAFPTIAENRAPLAPGLVAPAAGATNLEQTIEFQWKRVTDPDGDEVVYDLLVCADETFPASCRISYVIPPPLAASGVAAMGLLPLAFVFGMRRRRRAIVLPVCLAVLSAVTVMSCGGGGGGGGNVGAPPPPPPVNTDVKYTVSGLQAGTTYYWKVVARDAKGGEVESAVGSFVTR